MSNIPLFKLQDRVHDHPPKKILNLLCRCQCHSIYCCPYKTSAFLTSIWFRVSVDTSEWKPGLRTVGCHLHIDTFQLQNSRLSYSEASNVKCIDGRIEACGSLEDTSAKGNWRLAYNGHFILSYWRVFLNRSNFFHQESPTPIREAFI